MGDTGAAFLARRSTCFWLMCFLCAVLLSFMPPRAGAADTPELVVDSERMLGSLQHGMRVQVIALRGYGSEAIVVSAVTGRVPLVAWISEQGSDAITLLSTTNTVNFGRKVEFTPSPGAKYFLNVASSIDIKGPVNFVASAYSKSKEASRTIKFDPRIKTEELPLNNVISVDLSKTGEFYGGNPAAYYSFTPQKGYTGWYKVTASSHGIVPRLNLADSGFTEFRGKGIFVTARRFSRVGWKANDEPVKIVLFTEVDGFDNTVPKGSNVTIGIEPTSYDPELPFYYAGLDALSNPVVSLAVGSLISLVLSYYFFVRSIKRKTLTYRVVSARPLLASDEAKRSHLSLNWNNHPIEESVGVATVRLDVSSYRDIIKSDIVEPIRCEVTQVSKVIRATAHGTSGWQALTIIDASPPAVQIDASHLGAKDWLELNIIFTQPEVVEPGITVVGRIHDGVLSKHVDYMERWNTVFLGLGIVFYIGNLLINLLYSDLTMLPDEPMIEMRETLGYWWIWWFPFMATTSGVRALLRKLLSKLPIKVMHDMPARDKTLEAEANHSPSTMTTGEDQPAPPTTHA